jgi:hypothetical protein
MKACKCKKERETQKDGKDDNPVERLVFCFAPGDDEKMIKWR